MSKWRLLGCVFHLAASGDADRHGEQQENPGGGAAEDIRSECFYLWRRAAEARGDLHLNLRLASSQKACVTVEENTRLKSRLQAAEADVGQRQASSAEQDYEEVIQLLEAEIRDLKNQLTGKRQARGMDTSKASVTLSVPLFFLYLLSPDAHRRCLHFAFSCVALITNHHGSVADIRLVVLKESKL